MPSGFSGRTFKEVWSISLQDRESLRKLPCERQDSQQATQVCQGADCVMSRKKTYFAKCEHKRKVKKHHCNQFGRHCWWYSESNDRASLWRNLRNGTADDKYWKTFYLSGCRKFAKKMTNRLIRAKFRPNDLIRLDHDSIYTLQKSQYHKYFNYDNTIW